MGALKTKWALNLLLTTMLVSSAMGASSWVDWLNSKRAAANASPALPTLMESSTLISAVQRQVNTCSKTSDPTITGVSQLFLYYAASYSFTVTPMDAINWWYSQGAYYNLATDTCNATSSYYCNFYKQLMSSASNQIGCAVSYCPNLYAGNAYGAVVGCYLAPQAGTGKPYTPSGSCQAATCASLGKTCGTWSNGCGGTVTCGSCSAGQSCSSYGACLCNAQTCSSLGKTCGTWADGCGGSVNCGSCGTGYTCNSNGQCVSSCTPRTCAQIGVNCGTWDNGCGGTVSCGSCASGSTCSNGQCVASCQPNTCSSLGMTCGSANDGCGNTLNCGSCASGSSCVNNVCVASSIPASWDTTQKWPQCTPAIQDQGQCGSCYAFSATWVITQRYCIATGTSPNSYVSPQVIMNCGKNVAWWGSNACAGGWPSGVMNYMQSTGMPTCDGNNNCNSGCQRYQCRSSTYWTPNTGRCPFCDDNSNAVVTKMASTPYNLASDIKAIQQDIMAYGGVTVAFDVCQDFYDFFGNTANRKGVYSGSCSSASSNYLGSHAVVIIGWGSDQGGYWLIANSWATWWGDNGYFRMAYTSSGILKYVVSIKFGNGRRSVEQDSGMEIGTFTPGPDVPGGGLVNPLPVDSPLIVDPAQAAVSQYAATAGKTFTLTSVNQASSQVTAGVNFELEMVVTDEAGNNYVLNIVVHRALDNTYQVMSSSAVPVEAQNAAAGAGSSGLETGAVVGIAVGAAAAAALVTAAGAVIISKLRKRKTEPQEPAAVELATVPNPNLPSDDSFATSPRTKRPNGGIDPLTDKTDSPHLSITARKHGPLFTQPTQSPQLQKQQQEPPNN